MIAVSGALELLCAALPIITLIALLVFRVRPLPAVLSAIVVLIALGVIFPITLTDLAVMSGRISNATVNVVLILLGGLVLSVFAAESGAQQTMSRWFEGAVHNPQRAVLMYGLGLTPFMEATIGWGVSLILAVPLLRRVGLSATRAAAVGLLGLVVCPWGSLGPGIMLTAELGEVTLHEIGTATAWYNLPVILSATVMIAIIGIGRRMTVMIGVEMLVCAGVLWGMLYLVSATIGAPLAGVLGGLAVIMVILIFARLHGADLKMSAEAARAFAPFGVLVAAMLSVSALAAVIPLGAWKPVVVSPGLWLIVSAATAPHFYRMSINNTMFSFRRGCARWVPVTVTTLSYILFGTLLSVSGMSGVLAEGAASTGGAFLIALPFVGALAGYLTASITSVATMLAHGVTDAAVSIGVDPSAALGAQTAAAGSAVGASPSRLALAVGIAEEGNGEGSASGTVNYGKLALATISMSLMASVALAVMLWVTSLG